MSQTENDTIPLPPRPSASPAYPDEYDINNPSEHNAYSETGDHNTAYSEIGDSLNITAMGLDLTDEAAIDDNMLQVLSTAGNTDVHYKMVEGEVDSDEEAEQKLLEQAYKKGAKKGFKGGKAAGFKGGISALVRHSVASVFDKVGKGMSMNKYETTTGYQYGKGKQRPHSHAVSGFAGKGEYHNNIMNSDPKSEHINSIRERSTKVSSANGNITDTENGNVNAYNNMNTYDINTNTILPQGRSQCNSVDSGLSAFEKIIENNEVKIFQTSVLIIMVCLILIYFHNYLSADKDLQREKNHIPSIYDGSVKNTSFKR